MGEDRNNQDYLTQELYRLQQLMSNKTQLHPNTRFSLWDSIDAEITPLNESQRSKLMNTPKYIELQEKIKMILETELLRMMKPYVEANPQGKVVLQEQLDYVRSIKNQVIAESNQEIELFKKFQRSVELDPHLTWDQFVKSVTN